MPTTDQIRISPKSEQGNNLRHFSDEVADYLPPDIRPTDPDLQIILDAWPKLPEAIRVGIVAMVKAAFERIC